MREEFLQLVWAKSLFDGRNLLTTDGREITIIDKGQLNHHGGPDFQQSRVRIGGQLWAGTVEVHLRSSDWYRHHHHTDSAYSNVILHVVWQHDVEVEAQRGERLPVLELNGRIPAIYFDRFQQLGASAAEVPCEKLLPAVPRLAVQAWLTRALVERLERKVSDVKNLYDWMGQDYLQTLYSMVAGYLGLDQNRAAMQQLTLATPLSLLLKYSQSQHDLEALLLGMGGFLVNQQGDEYTAQTTARFSFLSAKHNLKPRAIQWQFGRVRPDARPEVRLATLAAIVPHLQAMNEAMLSGNYSNALWQSVKVSPYWHNHVALGMEAKASSRLSSETILLLEVNALGPYLFFYGKQCDQPAVAERAMGLLEAAKAESNRYVRRWKKLGYFTDSAAFTQGVIETSTRYCAPKKCVLCGIGKTIIAAQ